MITLIRTVPRMNYFYSSTNSPPILVIAEEGTVILASGYFVIFIIVIISIIITIIFIMILIIVIMILILNITRPRLSSTLIHTDAGLRCSVLPSMVRHLAMVTMLRGRFNLFLDTTIITTTIIKAVTPSLLSPSPSTYGHPDMIKRWHDDNDLLIQAAGPD